MSATTIKNSSAYALLFFLPFCHINKKGDMRNIIIVSQFTSAAYSAKLDGIFITRKGAG